MRAVDTNVVVRIVTGDTVAHAAVADEFVKGGTWVPLAAVLETAWVLAAIYDFPPERIAEAMEMLLRHTELVLEEGDLIQRALETFRGKPTIQFADAFILESARRAGHLPLGTFDKKLASRPGTFRLQA